ncbi:transcription elongation factor GreA [Actinobaculum suis]|uniref:GreA/GreB family elongation factor n=1 Tax=Actinobaculum suis TaxID=1657 RepID=UPI00066FCEE9|nr:GreA/GreB family elongation factor [Actinobaculum suis]KMY23870.1 transcription elongation factor GreA [Actinobaculum suis]
MAQEQQNGTWLSPATYDHLKAELEEMMTTRRADITRKIEVARAEGDLSENGAYQAAREEQGKLEGRIQELQQLLDTAQVSEPPTGDVVASGCVVTAKIGGVEETFLLGSREASDLVDIEVYPETAPLGQAILGLKEGQSATFRNRRGRAVTVEILKIQPYEG